MESVIDAKGDWTLLRDKGGLFVRHANGYEINNPRDPGEDGYTWSEHVSGKMWSQDDYDSRPRHDPDAKSVHIGEAARELLEDIKSGEHAKRHARRLQSKCCRDLAAIIELWREKLAPKDAQTS